MGSDRDTDAWVGAAHEREVVGGTSQAVPCAVAELDETLWVPLVANGPVCVAGETETDAIERCVENVCLALGDRAGFAGLEHLEAGGDLVEREILVDAAVVRDVDRERVAITLVEVSVLVLVERNGVGQQGHAGGQDCGGELHRDRRDRCCGKSGYSV